MPVLLVVAALIGAFILVGLLGVIAGCSPAAQQDQVDVATYTTEEFWCVERERLDLAKCRADKPACRARIDACRAHVKAGAFDGGAP